MFTDARKVPNESKIEIDICIIGAGAAGITIARELAQSKLDVCVLESGDLENNLETQSLYDGENVGVKYWALTAARLRYFGGTTNHWGGVCLPLGEDDFEVRDWVNKSGWPLRKSDLIPYYRRAHPIVQLGKFSYIPEDWETDTDKRIPFDSNYVITKMLQRSPPTHFGTVYRDDMKNAKNITVYLNANALEIDTNDNATRVKRVQVACLTGTKFSVSAKAYVLALGGIENARLLLLSNRHQKNGLGNENDLVGRYFADHPYLSNLGFILLRKNLSSYALYQKGFESHGSIIDGFLALTKEVNRREKLLTTRIHISPSTWKSYNNKIRANEDLLDKIQRIFNDLTGDKVSNDTAGMDVLRFGAWTELIPNPDSRVYLGDEIDKLGQRKIVLDWRIGQEVKTKLIQVLKFIGTELGRLNLGRMWLEFDEDSTWPPEKSFTPGLHHMGTTRMHTNPKSGVVDENCKLHGTDNLFVAGSSVFPTYGAANPTLTIVALSLRLSDHLKERMI